MLTAECFPVTLNGNAGKMHCSSVSSSRVVPAIYGYVNQKDLSFEADSQPLTLTLISRRSRHRAGCRYLRRGVDEEGNVANFVETELVLRIFSHCLSFVQVHAGIEVVVTVKFSDPWLGTDFLEPEGLSLQTTAHHRPTLIGVFATLQGTPREARRRLRFPCCDRQPGQSNGERARLSGRILAGTLSCIRWFTC